MKMFIDSCQRQIYCTESVTFFCFFFFFAKLTNENVYNYNIQHFQYNVTVDSTQTSRN